MANVANSTLANALNKASGANMDDVAIYNYIKNHMPADTANLLPPYEAGQSFAPQGKVFTSNPRVFNDYLGTLAIQYGLIVQKVGLAQNPLRNFKRGIMPYGGKIETVVYDTIEPKIYRPDLLTGEDDVFAQHFGRVLGDTYTQYQDIEATNTIVDTQDTMYFQNLSQFHTFIFGKAAQLVNGAILDEYFQTKLVLSKAVADGFITSDTAKDVKDLAAKINYWSRKLRYFSRDNNVYGVNQATMVEDIVVLVSLKQSVNLDVDYFANVFNAEVTRNLNIKMIEVDEFPSVWEYTADHTVTQDDIDKGFVSKREHPVGDVIKKGELAQPKATGAELKLDGDKVGAIVLDRDALQLWDALPLTLSTVPNPKKRYSNLFINKKTALMFVQALNSKVIYVDPATELDVPSSPQPNEQNNPNPSGTGTPAGGATSTPSASGSSSSTGGTGSSPSGSSSATH